MLFVTALSLFDWYVKVEDTAERGEWKYHTGTDTGINPIGMILHFYILNKNECARRWSSLISRFPKSLEAFSLFLYCKKKSPLSLFSEVPWYHGFLLNVGITKSPLKTTLVTCQLSQAGLLGLYPQHNTHMYTEADSQPPPPFIHISAYIHTDT